MSMLEHRSLPDQPSLGLYLNTASVVRFRSSSVLCTAEMAREWLERWPYRGQRNPSRDQLALLAKDMRAGRFGPSTISVYYVAGDPLNQGYLVNGRQRLTALSDSPPHRVPFTLEETWVRSYENVREAYAHFDTHRRRSDVDILRGVELGSDYEVNDRALYRINSAVRFIQSGFRSADQVPMSVRLAARDPSVRVAGARHWMRYGVDHLELFKSGRKHLRQASSHAAVMSVAMVTRCHQPEDALEFWEKVAGDVNMEQGDPAFWCAGVIAAECNKQKRYASHLARLIATCWNAHYDGRKLSLVKNVRNGLPIHIKGTPYKGEEWIV